MADTSISENLIKTMSRWLLASAALLLVLQLNQVGASAAAAAGLSEVWSETDGMRMKYSTNHGELLSSKGSEMSLSSDQKHHQLEPASESGGASDESAAVAEGGGGGSGHEAQGEESSEQQAKGEEGEGGSEQADSRKTEKVVPVNPTAGRVHSYSSLAGQTATGHAPASSRAQHAHHHHHQFKSSASSRSTSEAPSSGYDFSGSAPEDQMVNDNGEATATATGGGSDEQSSVDAADEPLANEAPAGTSGGKFRTPGKHFKEAVKMVGSHKQETKAEAEADEQESSTGSKNDDDTKDEGEEKSGAPEEDTPSRLKSSSAAADETDENADFNASWGAASGKRARAQLDEETNGDFVGRPFEGSAAAAGLDAESPITMAGSPLEQPEQHMFRPATARNQMMGVSAGHFNGNEDGESDAEQQMPLSNFRAASPSAGPMFYEGSAQSSRALPSAGNKERSQPSQSAAAAAAAAAAGKRQQQQSQQTGPATNKQAYKQLSYFKSVPDHPQRASQAPRYPTGAVRNNQPADNSPDSVRDNFISPGHYPGSMPHLTQAASEIAQSKSTAVVGTTRGSSSESAAPGGGTLANAKEEQSKSSSQQVVTNAGSQSAPVSSDTNQQQQQQQQQGATTTAKQPAEEQQNQVAESKEVVSVVAVTPAPEAQQESQQIMAPILVTTTTMAPLLPTPASSSTTPAPSSTTTTSQTPALKRFKFRKYR